MLLLYPIALIVVVGKAWHVYQYHGGWAGILLWCVAMAAVMGLMGVLVYRESRFY